MALSKQSRWFALCLVIAASTPMGCAEEDTATAWSEAEAADPEVEVSEYPLIPTWYNSSSRSIYARASIFRGTPNVKITTRTIATGRCNVTGPVVMRRLPKTSTSRTICSNVGLTYGPVSTGGNGCRTSSSSTEQAVMYYNYTSATQTQLNYNVFDWNGARALDSSGWQPAGPGNGCARSIP
ncbi:MAG: hypothetical protein KC613_24640 [Myxococcales bacterium]|nr:hypothetical protein [Myxococcales bacterium]